jgi:7SK snRNA methylphosphate capping enzyme
VNFYELKYFRVHLNWGDAGLKRFFARAFRQLKAGGRFILEYESFNVYRKHCNRKGSKQSPDEVINTFKSIQLFPENFANYLLDVVGFTHVEEMMVFLVLT